MGKRSSATQLCILNLAIEATTPLDLNFAGRAPTDREVIRLDLQLHRATVLLNGKGCPVLCESGVVSALCHRTPKVSQCRAGLYRTHIRNN